MGDAFDIAALTASWEAMLSGPERPLPGAWWAAQAPGMREISEEARRLEPSADRRILRHEAALLVDRLLSRVARRRGALDVAIGEALAAVADRDTMRLGYAGVDDYAREELGIAGRTALMLAQLARRLRDRPLLREAVRRGEVSPRKALAVLPVAWGAAESRWVERARRETVRALEAAVRAAGAAEDDPEEEWERVRLPLSETDRAKVDEAMELAGRTIGAGAPAWQRVEVISQEYLGSNPEDGAAGVEQDAATGEPAGSGAGGAWTALPDLGFACWPVQDALRKAREELEAETRCWEALGTVEAVAAPQAGEGGIPRVLDAELRRLAAMRDRWDELVGHLGLLVQWAGLWRVVGYASFGHYCSERLGMAPRTVEQRAWLERRFYDLPPLREALRARRLSYEKARLVAGVANETTVEHWIRRAEGMNCIALRHEIEAREDAQMRARGSFELRMPRRVAELLAAAFRAVRRWEGRFLEPEECMVRLAEHFIGVWKGVKDERSSLPRRVRRRDGFCQAPGCSRRAVHAHHVRHRSAGGTDEEENLVGLCAAHHLHGVHLGYVRVTGRAPGGLVWELVEQPGGAPLAWTGAGAIAI